MQQRSWSARLILAVLSSATCLLTIPNTAAQSPTSEAAQSAYLHGNELNRNGDSAGAMQQYMTATELDDTLSFAWTNLGHLFLRTGNSANAVQAFQKAHAILPLEAKSNYNLAVALQSNDQNKDALEYYQSAIRIDPNHVNAHYNLGVLYQESSAILCSDDDISDEADGACAAGAGLGSEGGEGTNACHTLSLSESLSLAALSYLSALSLDPNHIEARLNYCNILFAAHSDGVSLKNSQISETSQAALDSVRKEIEEERPISPAGASKGNIEVEVEVDMESLASSRSTESLSTAAAAAAAAAEGGNFIPDLAEIEQCYLDVLTIDPKYVRGVVNLASFYMADEETLDAATEYFAYALELDPKNVMARHALRGLQPIQNGNGISIGNTLPDEGKPQKGKNKNGDIIPESLSNKEDYEDAIDPEYVRQLFDSYSFHFDRSLAQLDYRSHFIVAELVGKYANLLLRLLLSFSVPNQQQNEQLQGENSKSTTVKDEETEVEENNDNSSTVDQRATPETSQQQQKQQRMRLSQDTLGKNDPKSGIYHCSLCENGLTLKVLDLGAGTGLACQPVREQLLRAIDRHKNTEDCLSLDKTRRTPDSTEICGIWTVAESNVHITAVDISPKMLKKAREERNNCYQAIVADDIVHYLSENAEKATQPHSNSFDLVIAADVFMYFGELHTVLGAIRDVLRHKCTKSGEFFHEEDHSWSPLLIFTVELLLPPSKDEDSVETQGPEEMRKHKMEFITPLNSDAGYVLQPSGRFSHAQQYVEDTAQAAGFIIKETARFVPRMDKGKPIAGAAFVMQLHC